LPELPTDPISFDDENWGQELEEFENADESWNGGDENEILSPTIVQLRCLVVDRNGHMMSMNLVVRDMTRRRTSNGNFPGPLVSVFFSISGVSS
jgi:hypothetical protein